VNLHDLWLLYTTRDPAFMALAFMAVEAAAKLRGQIRHEEVMVQAKLLGLVR
jgi:hypothetical protein